MIKTPEIDIGVYTFFAPPKQGKTYLIKSILYKNSHKFRWGVIFTTTGKFNGDYDYIPRKFIHSSVNDDKIKAIIKIQTRLREQGMAKKMFIVMDDMLGSVKWDSPIYTKLLANHRHYNICLMITSQYCKKIPSIFRDCTTKAYIFKLFTKISIEAMTETYLYDKNIKQAKEFIEQNTGDNKFIEVTIYGKPNERYQVMKAPIVPKFKLSF